MVDPDNVVTADANRTNNYAELDIFIGRLPVANLAASDNVYTFENVTIDASASYDNDGGDVECYFEIKEPTDDGIRTESIDSTTCTTSWFWADDGDWEVKVIVVDDELDEVHMTVNATIHHLHLRKSHHLNTSCGGRSTNYIRCIGQRRYRYNI